MKKSFVGVFLFGIALVAHAGPPVTVVFKNLGTAVAKNVLISQNEKLTNASSTPLPASTVPGGASNTFVVANPLSPDANMAALRYQIGTKECVFYTAYVNAISPVWSKSATPSGGATCTATITSVNPTTNAWNVQFTMK